ncbi:hypothetical protein [Phyllobacterium lublinensis]|uniref:hypothetical protein n=1 Tax=Phyllobacterium lublinensis TaxID=2875708 RepID=UPI001CCEBFA8|nr:hypothetical protein [Phyllobacterium sp. 2063]MBZ9656322.1 hypothetical protein [Phyllobacterium sp. 2063]
MRTSVKVLTAIVLFAALGVGWLSLQYSNFERDRSISEWRSLSETENLLKQKPVPEAWSAGVFISERGLNTLLESLKDAQIAYDSESRPDEDTVVTLRAITAYLQPGIALANLRLDAHSKNRDLTVNFEGQASLVFKGIEQGENGTAQAVFGISLLKLDPEFGWEWFKLNLRSYATDLIETDLMLKATEAFTMRLPFKNTFAYDLKQNLAKTLPVRVPKDENWIKVQFAVPSSELSQDIRSANAVILDDGIWLLTDFSEKPVVHMVDEPPSEILADIARKRKNLEQIRTPRLKDAAIALWLNGTVLKLVQERFNHLPAANRTATVKSVQFKGRLADQKWRDDFLGEGGIFAELADPRAVAATAVVNSIRMSLTNGRRLKASLSAQVDAKASVRLDVDPLIGRGTSAMVGLLGNADLALEIDAGIDIKQVGGNTVVMLKPKIGCREIKLGLKPDSKVKFEEAWVSVPSVEANITLPVGLQTAPDVPLLSDLPFLGHGRGTDGKPIRIENGDDHFLFTPAWTEVQYALVPDRVEGNDGGLWIAGKLLTKYLNSETAGYDRSAEERKLAVKASEGQAKVDCPNEPSFALTIGDLEFGSNEELVKFFQKQGLPLPQIRDGSSGIRGTRPAIPSPIPSTPDPTLPKIPSPIPLAPEPTRPKIPSPIPDTPVPPLPNIPPPLPPNPAPTTIQ